MQNEVRRIPAAPRRVRAGPLVAHRWPLLAIGGLMAVFGGLVTWMLHLAAGAMPSDQQRLDVGPTAQVEARVTQVDPPHEGPDGGSYERVHYHFRHGGSTLAGSSLAPAGRFRVDGAATVELLPEEPNRNRIVNTVLIWRRAWLRPERWLGAVVVPGVLLLFGWLTGVFRLRQVLVHGDVSVGTVTEVETLRWVLPETVRVGYRFRDHGSKVRTGRHWVRARSALGARLLHQHHTGWYEPIPVLFDRQLPQWNRMMLADDFLRSPPVADDLELLV